MTENGAIIQTRRKTMLTEERYNIILNTLRERQAVTVSELTELLNSSESTVRRDLAALDEMGQLRKVHGGATALEGSSFSTSENDVLFKQTQYGAEKRTMGAYASRMIGRDDFVYIDAGTSTEALVDAITETGATFVTNGIIHAEKLLRKGCEVYVLGGYLKRGTEAIIGEEALMSLDKYNFTLGFFGTNGVDIKNGFTTPDVGEAMIKEKAYNKCLNAYVLCDPSKFNKITPVTFGKLEKGIVITTVLDDPRYRKYTKILEANQ